MSGSPADSNEWATVTDLASEAGISLEKFLAWNPAVSSDCKTNYWVDEAYCVGISGDDDGSATTTSTASPTTTSKPTPPGPTMTGSPADCNKWSLVTDGLSCTDLATQAGISLAQFLAWNPAVSSDCSTKYWLGEAYCVGVSGDAATTTKSPTTTRAAPTSSSKPTPPGPTMTGSPADCNKWSLVTDAGLFYTDLATQPGISLAQFLAWNPAVSSDCSTNYWLGEAYYVGVAGDGSTTLTTTTTTTTTKPTPPGHTMSGSPANCNKWPLVTDGLTCTALASQAGITLSQFLAWNPAVSSDCVTNYWLVKAYCVGVGA